MKNIETGSAKQIAWAEDIRSNMMKTLNQILEYEAERLTRHPEKAEKINHEIALVEKFAAALEQQTDAKWWIENHAGDCVDMNTVRARLREADSGRISNLIGDRQIVIDGYVSIMK